MSVEKPKRDEPTLEDWEPVHDSIGGSPIGSPDMWELRRLNSLAP